MPPSTNRLWRYGGRTVRRTEHYKKWQLTAHGEYLMQYAKCRPQPLAKFKIMIVLDRNQRGLGDGDNRIKALLDFCQMEQLIFDDRYCEGGSWSWGDAPAGCRVVLEEVVDD